VIESLIFSTEGKTLEFKENTKSLNKIIQTIIAFANTAGGIIIVGIKDKNKEIIGVEYPLKEEEKIANAVADSIIPLFLR
jgi:ATP-dependent DNA helicase RecG